MSLSKSVETCEKQVYLRYLERSDICNLTAKDLKDLSKERSLFKIRCYQAIHGFLVSDKSLKQTNMKFSGFKLLGDSKGEIFIKINIENNCWKVNVIFHPKKKLILEN